MALSNAKYISDDDRGRGQPMRHNLEIRRPGGLIASVPSLTNSGAWSATSIGSQFSPLDALSSSPPFFLGLQCSTATECRFERRACPRARPAAASRRPRPAVLARPYTRPPPPQHRGVGHRRSRRRQSAIRRPTKIRRRRERPAMALRHLHRRRAWPRRPAQTPSSPRILPDPNRHPSQHWPSRRNRRRRVREGTATLVPMSCRGRGTPASD
jgi:hypothetical protein